jgi:hypothetical protein
MITSDASVCVGWRLLRQTEKKRNALLQSQDELLAGAAPLQQPWLATLAVLVYGLLLFTVIMSVMLTIP